MATRKLERKYYFSVEGETEKWYLEWLQKQINATPQSKYKVSFVIKVQKDPMKFVKSVAITGKTEMWHLSDYESDEPIHIKQFKETIERLKKAQNAGKQIRYIFGYSNLTIDLWMVLHKTDCNAPLNHRSHYLRLLNRAYGEQFEDMHQYKHEDQFNRCLQRLQLADVLSAIRRAIAIMDRNKQNGYTIREYCGYRYYKEHPSLEIWRPIAQILDNCGLYHFAK